jgi:hypothetical protein
MKLQESAPLNLNLLGLRPRDCSVYPVRYNRGVCRALPQYIITSVPPLPCILNSYLGLQPVALGTYKVMAHLTVRNPSACEPAGLRSRLIYLCIDWSGRIIRTW